MRNKKRLICLAAAIFLAGASAASAVDSSPAALSGPGDVRVTILYDNTIHIEGTRADWGFAALVEGAEKTILFDTGTKPEVFWHNVKTLGIDLEKVDMVVLSHEHGDHTGGLWSFLEKKNGIPVYFGTSYPKEYDNRIKELGAEPIRIDGPVELCEGVYTTGEMSGPANEVSMIFDIGKDLVVMTGCAHPGVSDIVDLAKRQLEKDVNFVFGGFHLMQKSRAQVDAIIDRFAKAGVVRCGATHCTGEKQIGWFKEHYRENFVPMGVGRVIRIAE